MHDTAEIQGEGLIRVEFRGHARDLLILRGRNSTGIFDTHATVESFNAAHGTALRVVPPDVADVALNAGESWRSLAPCFSFAVDASIAYEKPGTRLGEEIVCSLAGEPRVALATGKYAGEKNIALAAIGLSAKDFRKEGNGIVLDISDDRLIPIPDFPAQSGWYTPHDLTGVPHGKEVEEGPAARYLQRWGNSSYAGLLVREVDAEGCDLRQYVDANSKASWKRAVVAEVPERDAGKITAMLAPIESAEN